MKNNYHEQNGCHNCLFCYSHSAQDENTTYHCTLENAVPKHLPYGYGMKSGTINTKRREKELLKRMDIWNDWTKKTEIQPYGICEVWDKK